jgi:hypothetical protein
MFARVGYLPLLALLELPYAEVSDPLPAALPEARVPENQARAVSLRELVGFAVGRGSP